MQIESGGLDSSKIFTRQKKKEKKRERETYPVVPGAGLSVTGHADLLTPFTRVAQNPTQITTTILLAMSYAGF